MLRHARFYAAFRVLFALSRYAEMPPDTGRR